MAFVKVKECLTDPKQLVKLILLVVCVCITVYQLSECVNKILHPPTTSYYKFRYNKTVKYPALTVCRKPSFKNQYFPWFGINSAAEDLLAVNAFRYFRFANFTVSQFLNATTYSFEETVPMYGFKGSGLGENIDIKSVYYADHGLCHTIIPKETVDTFKVTDGYWLYLKHTAESKTKDDNGLSTSGFEIHIHDENDIKDDVSIGNNFLYIESAEDMYVTLSVQTFSRISTTQDPCISEALYSQSRCEEQCLHRNVVDQVGCTLPWLRHLEKTFPECSNYTQINAIANLFSELKRKDIIAECYCPKQCNSSIYQYQIESRRESDAIQSPSSKISIYFASNLITDLTEVVSYDWNFFISDVGGSLGFLLGLSVIGFINVIEELIKLVFKRDKPDDSLTENEQKIPHLNVDNSTIREGESLKNVMEFVANCDMYQHMQEKKMLEERAMNDLKY